MTTIYFENNPISIIDRSNKKFTNHRNSTFELLKNYQYFHEKLIEVSYIKQSRVRVS